MLETESPSLVDDNAKAYSVSELAFALKRTLEDAYGFVRLRGELSKVTHHSNGHVYLTLKDDR
ncbi:MAG TPA: exodeoxyribonuclease VII large subunit, partial [Caulobacteraceae bacterium]|nr:exodeoxyribonuclease VII large subunit [Caulobacteraceae bacterium]